MKPLWAEADRLAAEEAKREQEKKSQSPVEVIKGGKITTPFGAEAINPKTGKSYWIAGKHPGDDWNLVGRQDLGQPVHAAVSGRVVHAGRGGWGAAFGIHVIIEGGDHRRTAHCHLSSESVKVGEHVKAGDVIGKVGDTGNVNGPHCHVERRHSPYTYWYHIKPVYEKVAGG